MTEIGFYHCTRQPAVDVTVRLAEKALAAGQRVLVAAEEALLDTLDMRLWTDRAESFLAHGRAGGPDAALQPILLAGPGALAAAPENGAPLLMLVSLPLPARLEPFERIFLLFEEGSPAEAEARRAWKGLAGRADVRRTYWQQQGGAWRRAR